MDHENEQIVRRFYANRLTNDAELANQGWSKHATFRFAGSLNESQNSRTQGKGQEQITEIVQEAVSTWRWDRLEICSLLVDGDSVAVRSLIWGEHLPSGKPFHTELSDHIQIHDGEIVELIEFLDTRLFEQLEQGR